MMNRPTVDLSATALVVGRSYSERHLSFPVVAQSGSVGCIYWFLWILGAPRLSVLRDRPARLVATTCPPAVALNVSFASNEINNPCTRSRRTTRRREAPAISTLDAA